MKQESHLSSWSSLSGSAGWNSATWGGAPDGRSAPGYFVMPLQGGGSMPSSMLPYRGPPGLNSAEPIRTTKGQCAPQSRPLPLAPTIPRQACGSIQKITNRISRNPHGPHRFQSVSSTRSRSQREPPVENVAWASRPSPRIDKPRAGRPCYENIEPACWSSRRARRALSQLDQ